MTKETQDKEQARLDEEARKLKEESNEEGERRFGTEVGGIPFKNTTQEDARNILGKDILVKDYCSLTGEHGEYLIVLYEHKGQPGEYSLAMGGAVVIRKVKEAKEKGLLPLVGKIIKEERYFDIV